MTTGADVVSEARQWLGLPWQHQASLKGVATDCLGLISGVGLALGLPGADQWRGDSRMHGYGRSGNPRQILAACKEYLEPATGTLQLGDILWLRFPGDAQHFALVSCLAPPRIIHAFASIDRVAENSLDAAWSRRIVRAWRYRGLT